MLGASLGLGGGIAIGGTIGGLSAWASLVAGIGISFGGSAIAGMANSTINQLLDDKEINLTLLIADGAEF